MAKPQQNRPRLGRGLNALISISEDAVQAEAPAQAVARSIPTPPAPVPASSIPSATPTSLPATQPPPVAPAGMKPDVPAGPAVLDLAVEAIQPNPHQPRRQFDQGTLSELAASMKTNGVIQPIVVRKSAGGYQLIAGERRLRAAKLASLPTIPAIVRDVDSFTQAQMALVENIQREDINPVDRAMGYRSLMDQLGLTQSELAQRLGEDRSSIANHVRLLDLPDPVLDLIRTGQLNLGQAKVIAGVSDPVEQQRLAELCIAQGLTVRNLERMLTSPAQPATRKVAATPAHVKELESSITRQLGLRVQLRATSKSKGKLVIHYSSLDQFDDLVKRLGVEIDAE